MLGVIVVEAWLALLLTANTVRAQDAAEVLRFNVTDNYAEYEGFVWNSVDLVFRLNPLVSPKAVLLCTDGGYQAFLCLMVGDESLTVIMPNENSAKSSMKRPFLDNKWHSLHLDWNNTHLNLTVDEQPLIFILDINQPPSGRKIFLGGFPTRLNAGDIHFRTLPHLLSKTCKGSECVQYFKGCIANVKFTTAEGTVKKPTPVNRRVGDDSAGCQGACAEANGTPCNNRGKCVELFVKTACDCAGTGYEGEKCENVSNALYLRDGLGGFRYDLTSKNESHTKVAFRFISKKEHGVLFYMGGENDFLLMELVNGNLEITFNLGDGQKKFTLGDNALGKCWHWVQLEHKLSTVKVSIDNGRWHKSSSSKFNALNLGNNTFVIFGGSGPARSLNVLKAKDNFDGLMQDLHFNDFKIPEEYIRKKYGNKSIVSSKAFVLQDLLKKPECCASGDCSAKPETSQSSTTSVSTTTKASTSPTSESKNQGKLNTSFRVQLSSPTRNPHTVSVWTIVVVVLAAVLAVFITIYIIYRWNNRYSGSFNPSKNNPDEEGVKSEKYGYNFFLSVKAPKRDQETSTAL